MQKIYFDEAGNTGADLLNQDQKTFILCSNNYTPEECKILFDLFDDNKELHFVKLKNSPKGRESIIKLLNHELINQERIAIYVAHKELATVGQIVDQLIEPVMFDNEIDIYKYGLNIQWTNCIFYFGNFFWDKTIYDNLLNCFITMIRVKDQNSIDTFYKTAKELFNSIDDGYKKLISPILKSEESIHSILDNVDKFTIDLTISCFFVLCNHWYNNLKNKFDVICDNSKQIEHYSEYIEFVKSLEIPIQRIGYGSRTITFPTQINKLSLTGSEQEINIQISDIIASSLAFMYNNKNPKQDPFVEQIQDSKILTFENIYMIWPTPHVSPKDLNMEDSSGTNILDFLTNQYIIKENKTQ